MIAVHDIVKQYGAFTAVDHVNISVGPGEIALTRTRCGPNSIAADWVKFKTPALAAR